ncbi:MAG: peptidylprolyl isomerase [Chitinophagaceae bacterium]|jgi:peptidyl-prolyl cis-trans isomerase SurA
MKKALLSSALLIGSFMSAEAQSARVLADKIAGIVGDKIVLKSEIINYIDDIKRQGGETPPNAECFLLEKMMADKALILQAEKDSLPVSEEEVEAELDQRVRYFIMQYGGKEAFEQIAGRTIYQVKEDFRKSIKEGRLAQAMKKSIVENIKITPTEVRNFYDKIPKDSLRFYEMELVVGQIVVYPKAGRELEKFAIDELLDYKKQVESSQKSFETLARLYTEDPGSKQSGGRYEINKNDKQWDPNFKNGAFRLKEGQISPVIKSKFGYHIIQMVSRNGDDAVVRHILRVPQITEEDIEAARVKLDSVRAKLIAGTISFGEAVDKYSEDENSKFTAGLVSGAGGSFVTIDELDKDLVSDLNKLKTGEYSAPLVFKDEREKVGVRIVNLRSKTEPHRENMKDDYNKIAVRALEEKKNKAVERWFINKLPTYYIMVDKEFQACESIQRSFGTMVKK